MTYFYDYIGIQNVFKIWCSYHLFCIFNVCVTANVYIFVDTKRNYRDLWENSKHRESIEPENVFIHRLEVKEEKRNIKDDLVLHDL